MLYCDLCPGGQKTLEDSSVSASWYDGQYTQEMICDKVRYQVFWAHLIKWVRKNLLSAQAIGIMIPFLQNLSIHLFRQRSLNILNNKKEMHIVYSSKKFWNRTKNWPSAQAGPSYTPSAPAQSIQNCCRNCCYNC